MPWYLLNMKKMKHSLSPLSDPIEVLSFFFRSVSGDVGLEFTLIASGSYHIGSSFNRVTSLIKFQIMHVKIIELDQNLSFMKMKWLHRCWRRMLETKCVDDKFEMLVTDLKTKKVANNDSATNISNQSPS